MMRSVRRAPIGDASEALLKLALGYFDFDLMLPAQRVCVCLRTRGLGRRQLRNSRMLLTRVLLIRRRATSEAKSHCGDRNKPADGGESADGDESAEGNKSEPSPPPFSRGLVFHDE